VSSIKQERRHIKQTTASVFMNKKAQSRYATELVRLCRRSTCPLWLLLQVVNVLRCLAVLHETGHLGV